MSADTEGAANVDLQRESSALRPVQDRVHVRLIPEPSVTAAGIHLPRTHGRNPVLGEGSALLGRVVSVGPLVESETLGPGDVVAFNSFRGRELEHGGDTLLMLNVEEVLGVIETAPEPQAGSEPAAGAAQ